MLYSAGLIARRLPVCGMHEANQKGGMGRNLEVVIKKSLPGEASKELMPE